jgi:hypothetical protein
MEATMNEKRMKRRVERAFTCPVGVMQIGDHVGMVMCFDGSLSVVALNTDPDGWEDDYFDCADYAEAVVRFDKACADSAYVASQPDWEAQSRYDELHGTVNGSDPNVVRWQEEFANEH